MGEGWNAGRRATLLLAASLLLTAAAPAPHRPRTLLAATPISRMDLPWWRARHEAVLDRIHRGKVDLIWLGDSITQDWERRGPPAWADFQPIWEKFYGDRNAVNMGFKGDTTASLLWRIRNGEVSGIAPRVAVILIGANNLGRVHWSADDTVAGIETIIADLHQRLPQTRILLLSVLPSERSAWVSETTAEINRTLATRFAHSGEITYVDMTPVFLRDGHLDKTLFLDPLLTPPDPPLHPTAQGQEKMAAAMEPELAGLMGDRNHSAP